MNDEDAMIFGALTELIFAKISDKLGVPSSAGLFESVDAFV